MMHTCAVESSAAQLKLLLESLTGDSQARREAVEAYQRKIDSFNERLKEKEAEIAAINEKAKAIKNAVRVAGEVAERDVVGHIRKSIEEEEVEQYDSES